MKTIAQFVDVYGDTMTVFEDEGHVGFESVGGFDGEDPDDPTLSDTREPFRFQFKLDRDEVANLRDHLSELIDELDGLNE